MKQIITVLLCAIGIGAAAQATYHYSYTYDGAGRRTVRQITIPPAPAAPVATSTSATALKSGADSSASVAAAIPPVAAVVDTLGQLSLSIKPNPVLTSLEVQCVGSIPQGEQLQLYTLAGSPLLSTGVAAQSTTSIDFSTYSAGQYVLRCRLGNTEKVWQVVKQ